MKDLKKLNELKVSKQNEMSALVDKVKNEERAMTPEENELFDQLESEIKAVDDTIAKINKSRKLTEEDSPAGDEEAPADEESRALEQEERDIKAFASYIRSQVTGIEERDATNLTKGDNGAVIPTTIVNKIIEKVEELSPIYHLATKYNMVGNATIPVEDDSTDSITVAYADEFTDLTSHSNKFTTISLTGYLYGALTKISKSLLKNSDFNLTNWVVNKMAKKIAKFKEGELLNGTTNKTAGVAGSYDATKMKLELASKSAITADEIIDVQELIPDVYQADCIFIMHKDTRKAIRKLKDGDGNYLLQKDSTARWGYTLMGQDVFTSDNVAKLGTASKNVIFYGDFSGLAIKESEQEEIQILTEKFATQHAIGVVAWGEIDAKVEDKQKIAVVSTPAS